MNEPLDISEKVITYTVTVAYNKVLEWGGVSLIRDEVDGCIVSIVKNDDYSFKGSNGSTSGIFEFQQDVGGCPELNSAAIPEDTLGDGMPDVWKVATNWALIWPRQTGGILVLLMIMSKFI